MRKTPPWDLEFELHEDLLVELYQGFGNMFFPSYAQELLKEKRPPNSREQNWSIRQKNVKLNKKN